MKAIITSILTVSVLFLGCFLLSPFGTVIFSMFLVDNIDKKVDRIFGGSEVILSIAEKTYKMPKVR